MTISRNKIIVLHRYVCGRTITGSEMINALGKRSYFRLSQLIIAVVVSVDSYREISEFSDYQMG